MQCASEKRGERAREKRNIFSPDLKNTVTESLLATVVVVSSKQPVRAKSSSCKVDTGS